jgi:biopolymer transport protein ExbD
MRIKSASSTIPEVDMTPMIDVVFQLLAFFMMISNFEQSEADERVSLPKDQLAKPPENKRENSVVLNFGFERDKEGKILDPNPYLFFGDEKFTVQSVGNRLRQESQFYSTIGTDLADVTIEIRADQGVKTGMVQELIQLCQEEGIGFQRFALKATQKVE